MTFEAFYHLHESKGALGTIADDGSPIVVKVPDLSKAYHSNFREITSQGTGDGVKDFRYNASSGIIYWWQPHLISDEEKQKVVDWLEAMNFKVLGHKNVRDDFLNAHAS